MTFSILELALKVSTVMALAAATAGLMHRASAASRHLVWTLAVLAVLVMPFAALVLPRLSIPIARAVPVVIVTNSADTSASSAAVNPSNPSNLSHLSNSWNLWNPWNLWNLVFAYAAGVLVLLGRLALEQWKSRRILARTTQIEDSEWTALLRECTESLGLARPVRLVRSRDEAMPMAMGVRRPVIVIPSVAEMWDGDRRRAVLLHELAHVVRFDCLTQTLAEITAAVYWPHPGSWWMARRLRVERELACDDSVLLSGTEPRDYAGHLLEIAHSLGGYRAPALVVSMARPRQLEGRMLAMLDATRNRATPAASRRLLAAAIMIGIVAPLAAATGVVIPAPMPAASAALTPVASTSQNQTAARALSPGTWLVRLSSDGKNAQLTLSMSEHSFHSTSIPLSHIQGLAAILTGPGGPVRYTLTRDAGAFEFEGTIRSGAGGGPFTFVPSATFGAELLKRGFAKPTAQEQEALAWTDTGFAFIDELTAQKYARPTLQQLVNLALHGVGPSYVRELADIGYRFGNVDELVRQHDHGVDAQYIRAVQGQGLRNLTPDDLVRARDHGVSPDYVDAMRQLGYQLTLAELVAARDHGVDAAYVMAMATVGYRHPAHGELIKLRDHGITPAFVEELKMRGIAQPPSVDALIQLHDRGAAATLDRGVHLHESDGFFPGLHKAIRDIWARWRQ